MLINEMHYVFELGLDRVASQDRPDLYPNEKDNYLNRAIVEFAKTRYGFDENKQKHGFETDQERISNLTNLHIKSPMVQPALTPLDLGNGIYELRLSALAYRYFVLTSAEIKIRKNGCEKSLRHTAWQIDDKKTVLSDPSYDWGRVHANWGKSTNATSGNQYLGSIYFDTTDKRGVQQFEILSACINYLKYPNRVCIGGYKHIDDTSGAPTTPVTQCDIDDIFHDEIVNIAVSMAYKDIQDQFGYQTSERRVESDK
jgi:hypothetical protein